MPIRDDSAGSYGTWDDSDLSWLDYLKATGSDIGSGTYNAIANITGALSPIGTSPEGNMAFQVPPMVSGIADSYARLAGTPSQPGNAYNITGVPELDAPIQADMSNVLLSLYGGNAVAGLSKPKGALGAGAMREKPEGITAYHGSPHDFDKFSLDKIGTGEGAQAYGHGLYFADAEDVARGYRDKLSVPVDNVKLEIRAQNLEAMGNPEKAAEVRAMKVDNPGKMYQVRINADPESFLDWDKPLSQQSESVRNALKPMADSANTFNWPRALLDENGYPSDVRYLYEEAARKSGSGGADTSTFLNEKGIPGIRYLDGNSRGASQGSSNYVVFDDSLIEILKKYGMAGGALGAGALAQPDQASAQDLPDWLRF